MTPYPPGYISATNALRDPKSSPEMRHAAQTVLDDINQRRLERMAPAHLANLRNPAPEPSQWPAVIAMVAAAICTVVIAILLHKGWGL